MPTPQKRAHLSESREAKEAVSESSVRFRRRRRDDDGFSASAETPVRTLDFRRRQKETNDSESGRFSAEFISYPSHINSRRDL